MFSISIHKNQRFPKDFFHLQGSQQKNVPPGPEHGRAQRTLAAGLPAANSWGIVLVWKWRGVEVLRHGVFITIVTYYVLLLLLSLLLYVIIIKLLLNYWYIYIRQGEEVPREDVNQDHWIGEKTVFHCGKMEIFHVVFFIVEVFQLRINFFYPSKLKLIRDHHNIFFWYSYFLHWNYEVHILCYIKDHWKRI
jgi:hypothetical protein